MSNAGHRKPRVPRAERALHKQTTSRAIKSHRQDAAPAPRCAVCHAKGRPLWDDGDALHCAIHRVDRRLLLQAVLEVETGVQGEAVPAVHGDGHGLGLRPSNGAKRQAVDVDRPTTVDLRHSPTTRLPGDDSR